MITTEEAIKTLKENCCAMCAYGSQDMDSCDIRGCDNRDAIKALEQEPILDKIRAEIADTLDVGSLVFIELHEYKIGVISTDDVTEVFNRVTREEVLKIIDKYRAEQEGEE